jgi:tetratricopeptide (TPR) repeat protein
MIKIRKVVLLFLLLCTAFAPMGAQTDTYYISLGLDAEEEGDYSLAILYYDSALQLNASHAVAFYNRGACYAALANYGSALVDYNKALLLDPDLADAFYNRAIVHHYMNNPVLALADVEAYIALQSYDTMGFLLYADLLYKQNDFTGAIKANQKLIDLGLERRALVFKNQGMCYNKLQTYSMAEYLLTQAIVIDPGLDVAYLERAKVRFNMELYKDALDDLYEFMNKYPKHLEGLKVRSACLFNTKKYAEALLDYQTLMQLEPTNWEWEYEKGNVLLKLGRDKEAVQSYSTALQTSPQIGWILVLRGIAQHNIGAKEEACLDWNQSRLLGEEEAIILYNRYCNP